MKFFHLFRFPLQPCTTPSSELRLAPKHVYQIIPMFPLAMYMALYINRKNCCENVYNTLWEDFSSPLTDFVLWSTEMTAFLSADITSCYPHLIKFAKWHPCVGSFAKTDNSNLALQETIWKTDLNPTIFLQAGRVNNNMITLLFVLESLILLKGFHLGHQFSQKHKVKYWTFWFKKSYVSI